MKKKDKKPIIKSRVIIEGNAENSFMKNKLPKIIHDLEKFTKRELRVILSPSLNVSTTNIFKNFEPLPKETPRKNLKNIVSSTPYCGRYIDTQFTTNSSLPSPIHLGSFNRNRHKSDSRKVTNSSSESSSVVYIDTEVNNSLKTCRNIKEELRLEEPKSSHLLEINRSVETNGQKQLKGNETHVPSKSLNNKQKISVEASSTNKSQNQGKEQELVDQSAQKNIKVASFSKSSKKKKKAEVSLKSTTAMTKHKELLKDRTQSSSKVDKRRKQQFDAFDQDSLESVKIAGSRRSQSKTDKRNVSTGNNSHSRVARSTSRSATRVTQGNAKKQSDNEESGIAPLKINENTSRLLRYGRRNGTLRAAEESKDYGSSGKTNLESNQVVDKPIEVQCGTVQVNTEIPPPSNHDMTDCSTSRRTSRPVPGDARKQPDKEESSIVSLKNDESRSRYVTSRSRRPDGTFTAAEEPGDIESIREINLDPKQTFDEPIDVQRKTVQTNTQTSPPSKYYISGKRRNQSGFKGSFKDVLIEMERQARLKFTASVPAWTQTSGLTLGENTNSDNDAVGVGAQIIQEITAKKKQMMCNAKEQNPIMSEAAKDKNSTVIGPEVDESRVAERVCKTPLLDGARQLNEERNMDYCFTQSFRKERSKFNQERVISFENLINKLEAKALAAQEMGEDSDLVISFNSNVSSNRRFKLPKKSFLNADENLGLSRCNSRHKSMTSRKKNLNSLIENLAVKSAARQSVAKKSTQTSCLGVELLQVSPANRKPEGVAPLFRRSATRQSCEHLKNLRLKKKSSVSNWKNSTNQSTSSPIPNIYDSIREGNVADCLNFSALSDACYAEYLHKPWRCPEVSSHTDTFPRLSFIRSEAAIAADALHQFDNDSDDESSNFDVDKTQTNNNVSLAPSNVSASKHKPHCRRYSKCKPRNMQNRKSRSCKKAPLSVLEVQNDFDDGIETEVEVERNASAEMIKKARKCSLTRQQDVSEIRQDEAVSQILRSSTRNLASNSETAESWTRNATMDGMNNTVNGTRTPKSSTYTRGNSVASIPKSWDVKKRRKSKNKGNRDASPIIPQQTPQKTSEENDRSSLTPLISNSKNNVSLRLPMTKSTMEPPSSSVIRLQSSVAEKDENLQPATSKKKKRKQNWNNQNSTVESSFAKKKAYGTNYPLAEISQINIIPNSGMGRSMRVRKTKTFEMPEELEKDGFVFSHLNRRSRAKSSMQKTKKRVSKKSSIQNDQKLTFQETNIEGALSPIEENDVNEDVVSGPVEVDENRFSAMPPPRTVPPKKKTLAVKNSEVSVDSGFETSNTGRKTGKTPRGCLKRRIVSSDVAGSNDSERDFRVLEQESNVLSRISSPIHNTPNSLEPVGNSARTDELPAKTPLRTSSRQKRSVVSPLNKYKKIGNAYIYKLYNTPDKQCEVGYLRLEGDEETGCFVFGEYSSVALSVKSGTSFVKMEDKSHAGKIDDWFHVFKGQKCTIRNTSRDQYLKLIYMRLR
ncbi:uncharacterized protein [Euwallacea similis]|uniref:uncharacterized protein isoform X2 n=1 Tax=Euwallacea similis TaxID=1736056 RepID=UPI00344FFCDA